jgi:hypothetical protein
MVIFFIKVYEAEQLDAAKEKWKQIIRQHKR